MENPIFIVGTPRSGTTLISNILDRHPDISIYFESKFLSLVHKNHGRKDSDRVVDAEKVISHIKNLEKAGLTDAEVLSKFSQTDQTFRSLFDIILKLRMEKTNKKRFGEKTPRHFLHVDHLLTYYPKARIIFVIRDPRHICSSYKRREISQGRVWSAKDAILKSLYWNLYISNMKKYKNSTYPDQILRVKFEDVVNRPGEAIKSICHFLQEEYYEEMQAIEGPNSSFEELRDKPGIRKEVLNRVNFLSKTEVSLIELICGKYMMEYNYKLVHFSDSSIRFLKRFYFYSLINLSYSRLRVFEISKHLRPAYSSFRLKFL